jgi:putative ABC transport system permease protein
MMNFWREVRFGLRLLWKSPGFTAVALIALALGIGANTAIFSLLYAVLLAPLPYPNADQLVMVWTHNKGERNGTSPSDFLDWQKQNSVFQSLNAWTGNSFTISTPDWTEQVQATVSTPGLFDDLYGAGTYLGRHFLPDDTQVGNDRVVILNYSYWQRKFGSDPNIVGKQLRMSGELYTVVGVAAQSPSDRGDSQISVPLALRPEQITRENHYLLVMGRLKPGVTLAAASANMTVIAQRLAQEYPKTNTGLTISVEPLKTDFLPRNTRLGLWLMMGSVCFVLLIACVNIANLLLAWSSSRQKEIAVRLSFGATRGRIFRQFLVESLGLATIGGLLGILLAFGILRGLMAVMPRNEIGIPYEADPHLSIPVLLFTMGATILSGLLFGSAPAWHAARENVNDLLKEGSRSSAGEGHLRLRRILVIAEFALAIVLVEGAGMIIRSFWNVVRADLGIRTDHVLTFNVPRPQSDKMLAEEIRAYYRQLMEKIEAVPGVTRAAASPGLPAGGAGQLPFAISGQPYDDIQKQPLVAFQPVTPGYYQTYGIRLTRGRYLNSQDIAGGVRVAIVSEGFVRRYLPHADPLTQRVLIPELFPGKQPVIGAPVEWQIVGVFHDVQYGSRPESDSPEVDVPFDQCPWAYTTIAVRTSGDPAALTKSLASAIRQVDLDLPMTQVKTMNQVVSESQVGDRFAVVVFGNFAGLALLLAAVGIYGVMTFSVSQRNHEVGIRVALGASRQEVLKLIMQDGMRSALIGLALGLPGVYFVGRTIKSLLYDVSAFDWQSFAGVLVTLMLAAMVACYFPAERATRIDPMVALREE